MFDSIPGQPILGPITRAACRVLLIVAVAGLIAAVSIHALAWFGANVPGEVPLFAGLFVVWVPTVLVSMRLTRDYAQKDFWKAALRGCPRWASRATMGLVAYVFLNFGISLFLSPGRGRSASGTEGARMMSAGMLPFYGIAAATLYSAIHAVDDRRRCPRGHVTSPEAEFCDKCGEPVAAVTPGAAAGRSLVR